MIFLLALLLLFISEASVLFLEKKPVLCRYLTLIVSVSVMIMTVFAFLNKPNIIFPWLGGVLDFSLNIDMSSGIMLILISAFSMLEAIYAFMSKMPAKNYAAILFLQASASGAAAADSLAAMIFFLGMLPFSLYYSPCLPEHDESGKASWTLTEKKKLSFLSFGLILIILFMAGTAITGYISGTMSFSEISSAKLTLDYGWSVAAIIMLLAAAFSLLGIFPFMAMQAKEHYSHPLWFRPFSIIICILIGSLIIIRIENSIFSLGKTASILLFSIGALTGLAGTVSAFTAISIRKLSCGLIQANAGIIAAGMAIPEAVSGSIMHILFLAPAGYAALLITGFIEKEAGTEDMNLLAKMTGLKKNMKPVLILLALYAAAFAALPPFGDSFRLILAGLAPHPAFFAAVSIIQVLTIASLIKGIAVFIAAREEEDNIETSGKTEKNTSVMKLNTNSLQLWQIAIAVMPLIMLLFLGFGGCLPEQIFIIPISKDLGIKTALPASGTMNIYIAEILIIMLGGLIFQTGNAFASADPVKSGNFIKENFFVKMLTCIAEGMPAVSVFLDKAAKFLSQTEKTKIIIRKTIWEYPSSLMRKAAGLMTKPAESSINFSLTLSFIIAAALVIFAASWGGN